MENDNLSYNIYSAEETERNINSVWIKHFSSAESVIAKKQIPFPIEALPLAVQEIITAGFKCLNFPPDFFGASILFAVSIAIGNTHRIEVKRGWEENAGIFIANVGKPNTNKSHPLSFALKPIYERDLAYYYSFMKQKQEYEQAEDKKDLDKPVLKKSIFSDHTPEAVGELLKNNANGLGLYVDELASWFKTFDRYHKGAQQEFWLSVWSGKSIIIDRKGSDPVLISLPFISVAGNIQPRVLFDLGKEGRSQNGFIDRILFAYPDSLQKPYWSDSEIDPKIIESWRNIISELLELTPVYDLKTSCPIPEVLKFNADAYQILKQWEIRNTDLCRATEDEALQSIYGKFDVHVVRLSLILEMLFYACGESNKREIGVEAVKGALLLADYFKSTAVKVNSIITNINPLDRLPTSKQKLYHALPDTFTTVAGVKVASSFDCPERTFKRLLNDKELFNRIRQGEYEKRL